MDRKIGIDVRKADDFGIGRYIQQLVHGLAGQPADLSFTLFGGPQALDVCRAATGGDSRFTMVRQDSRSYSLGEHISLPLALRREGEDLSGPKDDAAKAIEEVTRRSLAGLGTSLEDLLAWE